MKLRSRLETFSNKLQAHPIVKICDSLGKMAILLVVLTWLIGYLPEQMETRRDEKILRMWSFIHTATGSKTDGGRIEALESLVKLDADLNGIDLSNALLYKLVPKKKFWYELFSGEEPMFRGLKLQNTSLIKANFNHSDIMYADFSGSLLWHATFHCTNMSGVVLDGANLTEADLRYAQGLSCSQLKQANDWDDAYRDTELACGASLPDIQDSEYKKQDLSVEPIECAYR